MRPRDLLNVNAIVIMIALTCILICSLPVISSELIVGCRLESKIFRTLAGIGQRTCCRECTAFANCQSVNYNLYDFSCELNYGYDDGWRNKTADPEYVYMDRYHCHSLTSACPVWIFIVPCLLSHLVILVPTVSSEESLRLVDCSCDDVIAVSDIKERNCMEIFLGDGYDSRFCNLSCNRNQKCVLTDSNLAACIPTECDPFNEIIEGKTNKKGSHVGTTYLITCNTGFSGYQQFVCATNGEWESTHGACQCWYGTYLNENGTECIECSAGKYLPSVGQVGNESCIDCPAGSYSSSPGSKKCTECRVGYYQNKVGQTKCFACEAGTYSSIWGADSCKNCPPGKYSGSRAYSCRSCRPGSYNFKSGAPSCTLCPIRSYQDKYGSILCKGCPTANVTGSITC